MKGASLTYKWLGIVLLFIGSYSFAQSPKFIQTMEFVKVKNDKHREATYFYENNWKVFRDIALENGFIQSYQLLTISADSIADFDFLLITAYSDSLQLKQSEERFQKIIKEVRPNGPRLLNGLKPNDFRQNLYSKEAKILFSAWTDKKSLKR